MSAHIEWLHARHTQVTGIAEPGEFENDGIENVVGCIILGSEDGDGICIEGTPDDLLALAKRITVAAFDVAQATAASPELRSLYGMV